VKNILNVAAFFLLLFSVCARADIVKELNVHNMTDHPLHVQVSNFFNVEVFGAEDGVLDTTLAPYERKYIAIKIKKNQSVVDVIFFKTENGDYLSHPICEVSAVQATDDRPPFYEADLFQNDSSPLQCVLTDGFGALTVQEIH